MEIRIKRRECNGASKFEFQKPPPAFLRLIVPHSELTSFIPVIPCNHHHSSSIFPLRSAFRRNASIEPSGSFIHLSSPP